MSSYRRPDPQQRAPRSSMAASALGVGLVIFGVALSLWSKARDSAPVSTPSVVTETVDQGVLQALQQIVPTIGAILVAVIVLAVALLYKGRPHQD